jgi:hypothetical protein
LNRDTSLKKIARGKGSSLIPSKASDEERSLDIEKFLKNTFPSYELRILQSVVMLNVVMMNVVMLNVVMLNVVLLNVVTLNVVTLNVVMLNVVAPEI